MRLISAGSLVRIQSGPPSFALLKSYGWAGHPSGRARGIRALDIQFFLSLKGLGLNALDLEEEGLVL
jgi:hypothetical protein